MRGAWLAALVLGATLVPGYAAAQEARLVNGGMDLHLFRPALDSRGYFSVNGSEVMPHKEFSFGLVMDAGFGILRYNGFDNNPDQRASEVNTESRIARQAFTGTFMFNFGLIDRLVIGIALPITFFRGGDVQTPDRAALGGTCSGATSSGCLYNFEGNGLRSQGVGDLTLSFKARLLNLGRYPAGIAVTLRAQFPTAKTTQFAGEPGVALWPTAVFEFQPIEKIRLAVEGGYRWNSATGATFIWDGASQPSDPLSATDPVDVATAGRRFTYNDLITFGFGSAFRVARSLDIILEFYGSQIAQEIGTKGTLSMEALGGLKYFVAGNSFLYVAGGAGIPKTGFQAADARVSLGFMYEPAVEDRDKDGINDDDDACPDRPEDKDGFEDRDGCPDPDNDADGILDVDDACPLVPEDSTGTKMKTAAQKAPKGTGTATAFPTQWTTAQTSRRISTASRTKTGVPTRTTTAMGSRMSTTCVPTTRRTSMGSKTRTVARTSITTATASSMSMTPARTTPRPTTATRTRTGARTRGSSSSKIRRSPSSKRSTSRPIARLSSSAASRYWTRWRPRSTRAHRSSWWRSKAMRTSAGATNTTSSSPAPERLR